MACRDGDWRIVKLCEEGSRLRGDCAKLNSLGFLFVSLGLADARAMYVKIMSSARSMSQATKKCQQLWQRSASAAISTAEIANIFTNWYASSAYFHPATERGLGKRNALY